MSTARTIESTTGRGVPVRGDDIDTDRIIPARFLRCVTFDGIGEHAFEDDRKALAEQGAGKTDAELHPFDQKRFAGATVLIVNRNFGCGSSREHAPQSLWRWGIHAIIGESFAEIFFGNCVALGVPCVTLEKNDVEALQVAVDTDPSLEIVVDVRAGKIFATSQDGATLNFSPGISAGVRESFLHGTWDATSLLVDKREEIDAVANKLPYVGEFAG